MKRFYIEYTLIEPVHAMNGVTVLYNRTRNYKRTLKAKDFWNALFVFGKQVDKKYMNGRFTINKAWEYLEDGTWKQFSNDEIFSALAPF